MAYIDKDLLLKDIGESVVFTVKSGFISPELRGARKIIDRIKNAPTADVVEVKKIEIIRDDLKWWLKTNTKKGVVHIPKYFVENMIAKMDGERKQKNDSIKKILENNIVGGCKHL